MKVSELIEKLKACDPEAVVRVSRFDGGDYDEAPVEYIDELDLTKSLGYKVVDLGG
jgi:hypothetical protein